MRDFTNQSNIQAIEYCDYEEEMMDVEVEDVHCLYANGVLVHNCAEEQVLLANFAQEPALIEPLLEGKDIHKFVATKMFGHYDPTHRTTAKAIAFAANYGGTGYTIAKRLGCSEQEGNALLDKYNKTLARATAWKEEQVKQGRRQGYVYTYFGRPRAVYPYFQSSDKSMWGFAARTCANSPIQGSGGDIIRIDHIKYYSLIDKNSAQYDKEFDENTMYVNTIHDEINLYVKPEYVVKAFDKLKWIMEMQFPNWKVPLKVSPSVGVDWGHQIELSGFAEDGTPIPDVEEDLSLL